MRSDGDRNKIKERVNKSKVNKTKKNKNTGREYKESLPQLNPGEAFSIPEDTDDQHPLNNPSTHAAHEVAGSAAAFVPPSADEVRTYCEEIGSSIDADAFCDYYTHGRLEKRQHTYNGLESRRKDVGKTGKRRMVLKLDRVYIFTT